MNDKMQEYLDRGLHGAKETNIDERKKYLTTIRERVIIALTNRQVMKNEVYEPIKRLAKEYENCHLFLDGDIRYSYLSKYVKLANEMKLPFTIVNDAKTDQNIALVLASKNAVDQRTIFVAETEF